MFHCLSIAMQTFAFGCLLYLTPATVHLAFGLVLQHFSSNDKLPILPKVSEYKPEDLKSWSTESSLAIPILYIRNFKMKESKQCPSLQLHHSIRSKIAYSYIIHSNCVSSLVFAKTPTPSWKPHPEPPDTKSPPEVFAITSNTDANQPTRHFMVGEFSKSSAAIISIFLQTAVLVTGFAPVIFLSLPFSSSPPLHFHRLRIHQPPGYLQLQNSGLQAAHQPLYAFLRFDIFDTRVLCFPVGFTN